MGVKPNPTTITGLAGLDQGQGSLNVKEDEIEGGRVAYFEGDTKSSWKLRKGTRNKKIIKKL